jgi:hypothetical protein
MSNLIRKHDGLYKPVWGIHYEDEFGNELLEMVFDTEAEQQEAIKNASDNAPSGAVVFLSWCDEVFVRPLISGVDYGRGSLKYKFGGGYVPRAAYQYRDTNHG